jgi:hypothetical protein
MEPLNKQDAAKYLGISVRTLVRQTGSKIARRSKVRDTDETLYDVAELDRYRAKYLTPDTPGSVIPDAPDTPETQALVRQTAGVPDIPDTFGAADTRSLALVASMIASRVDSRPVLLTKAEAVAVSGLPRSWVELAVKHKRLVPLGKGRTWRLRRDEVLELASDPALGALVEEWREAEKVLHAVG